MRAGVFSLLSQTLPQPLQGGGYTSYCISTRPAILRDHPGMEGLHAFGDVEKALMAGWERLSASERAGFLPIPAPLSPDEVDLTEKVCSLLRTLLLRFPSYSYLTQHVRKQLVDGGIFLPLKSVLEQSEAPCQTILLVLDLLFILVSPPQLQTHAGDLSLHLDAFARAGIPSAVAALLPIDGEDSAGGGAASDFLDHFPDSLPPPLQDDTAVGEEEGEAV